MDSKKEFEEKMEVIDWTIKHLNELDLRDQMIVLSAMMDLGDLLEHIYAKYKGNIFYMDLGDKK